MVGERPGESSAGKDRGAAGYPGRPVPRIPPVVLAPAAAAALGGLAVAISTRGAGERPWLAVPVLVLGAAAGAAPLRVGLAVAIVLSSFNGFLIDFVGNHASDWNELYVGALVVRSLVARLPSPKELGAAGVLVAVGLGYLATGTDLLAVAWGAKVLLLSFVAGWAIWRMRPRPGEREWFAAYLGLASATGASVILAAWQRWRGLGTLDELGIPLDERVRRGPTGALRAFGGFTSHAPFAYALAIALLAWLALVVTPGRSRELARMTMWVPIACLAGLAWSFDRTAAIAVVVAVIVVAAREARVSPGLQLAGGVAVVAAALAVIGGGAYETVFGASFRSQSSSSAAFRLRLWRDYLAETSFFGAGPASAGSAYLQADPPAWTPPLRFVRGWPVHSVQKDGSFWWMGTTAELSVTAVESPTRPPVRLAADLHSNSIDRRLSFALDGRRLARVRVPPQGWRAVRVELPAGKGPARLRLRASPKAGSSTGSGRAPFVSVLLRNVSVEGLPAPRTPALRVFQRVYDRTADPTSALSGIGPGVVDNQYVSWLFQYGVLGVLLGLAWLAFLCAPLALRGARPSVCVAGALVGVFTAVTALAVNVWEEAPTDFLVGIVLALTFASGGFRTALGERLGSNRYARAAATVRSPAGPR